MRPAASFPPHLSRIAIVFVILSLGFLSTGGGARAAVLGPRLEAALQTAGPTALLDVIIRLNDRPEPSALWSMRSGVPAPELASILRSAGAAGRESLAVFLRGRGASGLRDLWIINGVAARVPAPVLGELQALPEVAELELDYALPLPPLGPLGRTTAEWNVAGIAAPALWAMGLTGTGTVVATMDSGVDLNHPDLAPSWRGGTNGWFDPNGEHASPFDATGHGTAVMGILVGGDASGSTIGIAPDAQWIAVKIFNDAGLASVSAIHLGFQWILDPDGNPLTDDAPHVLNNSWGFDMLPGVCDAGTLEFVPDVQALRAAGISVVFAGGNAGPTPDTSVSPANYPETFSAGSAALVDGMLRVTLASSRGPSACDGGIFPDLVAPGAGIKTADLTSSGTLPDSYRTVDGSSFAAPHVAGAIALLRDAFSAAPALELEENLRRGAVDLGTPGPDDESGYGFLDLLGAYADRFVPALYRDILLRNGEPAGIGFWVDAMRTGTGSRARMVRSFFNIAEYDGVVPPVIRLYRSAFGRFGDMGGVAFWRLQLAGGLSLEPVAGFFAGSDEFAVLYGSPGNEEFVRIIYGNAFGREPTAEELALWTGRLDGGWGRGQVLAALSESPEHVAVSFPEVLTSMCFISLLQRSPDEVGFDFWVSFLRGGGSPEGMIETFLRSLEYQNRF